MDCAVEQIDPQQWDEFVDDHPEGTLFHSWRWREIVVRSFGHQPAYISIKEQGDLLGILPLFLVRSLFFGKSVVSVPLGVYGGPLSKDVTVEKQLLKKATDISRSFGAKYLEIRGNPYVSEACCGLESWKDTFQLNERYVTFITEIDSKADINLSRIPRKQRRMIRQGEKYGLECVVDNARLQDCYDVYAASVRNLGTPVYPLSYFENLERYLGSRCKVFLIKLERKIVAAVLTFVYKNQILPYYGGALREFLHLAPNDFMYWNVMSYGAAHGIRIFDFGRSKLGSGSFNFKRHWGFEPRSLPYWVQAINGHSIPDTSPLNPKLQWAIRLWRNLPLRVTNGLGPHIAKHIP